VGSTTDSQVFDFVSTAAPPRFRVIEFEKRPRVAATTVIRDVRASRAVTFEDTPTDRSRHAARLASRRRRHTSWALRLSKAFALELGEQKVDGPLDDGREISGWIRMIHEIAAEFELSRSSALAVKSTR
jgi:hypothetical protein